MLVHALVSSVLCVVFFIVMLLVLTPIIPIVMCTLWSQHYDSPGPLRISSGGDLNAGIKMEMMTRGTALWLLALNQ